MYNEVITWAQQVYHRSSIHFIPLIPLVSKQTSNANDKLENSHIVDALNNLQGVPNDGNLNWPTHLVTTNKGDHKHVNQYVDIFLAFDEAHTLVYSINLKGQP